MQASDFEADNLTATDPEDIVTVESLNEHVYSVTYDDGTAIPFIVNGRTWGTDRDGLYAATELIPLTDADA